MSALDKQEGGSHYKDFPIQPVEFITKNKLGFLEGCVIKRLCRWQAKDGIKDLRKAIHEIELIIELELEHRLAAETPGEFQDRCEPKQRAKPDEIAKAAQTIERALEPPGLEDYIIMPGTLPPKDLPDGRVIWEWCSSATHRRVGVMHRGQLVRD